MKPASRHITACKRCGAPICWAFTSKNGRKQPVDAEPSSDGNVAVMPGKDLQLYVRSITKDRPDLRPGEWQAMVHFATCPVRPAPRRW